MAKNPYLKSANEVTEFTAEQVMDLKKCADDPVYFAEKFCHIQHPVKGSVPVELYPYQKRMLASFKGNRNVVVLSSRQTGKCILPHSSVTVVKKSCIPVFKRCILFLINRKVYNDIFTSTD